MLSGRCPNSPAALLRPRRTSPAITMPTPTPSETLTKARSPGGSSPRALQMSASAQALAAFSITTGRPRRSESGSRRRTSRQPIPGARSTTLPDRSSMPGKATPTPRQRPLSPWSARRRWTSEARWAAKACGSPSVAKLRTAVSSRPTRSVATTYVRVTRTSTATAQRPSESRCSIVGLRPRWVAPGAPSRTSPCAIRSLTIRPAALRCMPSSRARSAREMAWCARSSSSTICRLIARGVLRVATFRCLACVRGTFLGPCEPCWCKY